MLGGALLVLLGFAMRMFVERRRFYRRNDMGIEEFSSYWKAVVLGTTETGLYLLGGLVRIAGVVQLVLSCVQR